ncbi:MAG: hypothetical protein ACTII7_07855 [Galactobacter sp.]
MKRHFITALACASLLALTGCTTDTPTTPPASADARQEFADEMVGTWADELGVDSMTDIEFPNQDSGVAGWESPRPGMVALTVNDSLVDLDGLTGSMMDHVAPSHPELKLISASYRDETVTYSREEYEQYIAEHPEELPYSG